MISMEILLERSSLNRSEPISAEGSGEDAHAARRERKRKREVSTVSSSEAKSGDRRG